MMWGLVRRKYHGRNSRNRPSFMPGPWGQGGSFSYNNRPKAPVSAGPGGPGGVGYFSSLENNLPLPQGSQRPYAQPTTISSLINGLLYQSRRDPSNYWGNFFGAAGGYGGTGYGQYGPSVQNPYTGRHSPYNSRGGYGKNGYFDGGFGGQNYGSMSQSTADALALSDAYFAPKRLNLAYQLGDMETDMRRLAVNLGRQVDDPILQAKLYKEAMMGVRTLDSEQNQFSINMVEQRRKEELQNQQFYSQMALEYEKMEQQNKQFYDQLDQQDSQFRRSQGY